MSYRMQIVPHPLPAFVVWKQAAVAFLSIGLICTTTNSLRAQNGWTKDQPIPGTGWAYSEEYKTGKLNQCQIEGDFQTTNGGSVAHIELAILSKGAFVTAIKDPQLVRRIEADLGWRNGTEFKNVVLSGTSFSARARAEMHEGGLLLVWPYDDQQVNFRRGVERADAFRIVVEGLTFLEFQVPALDRAWSWLKRCRLFPR